MVLKVKLAYFIILVQLYKCCDINDLKGELVSCNDEDTFMFHNGLGLTKTDNLECRVTSQGRHYQFKCVDGKWVENTALLENHSASLDALSHPRAKRGFWGAAECVLTLFSCLWKRPRPRDTNPPKLVCPDGDKIRYGEIEPFQTYRKVFWSEPTAEDDRDGTIRAIRLNGRPSGRHFKEGPTTVTYEAKDRQGNWARCDVAINVELVRCPKPTTITNGYFICHPSTEFVLEAWCRYGCYEGFDLVGETVRICQRNNTWSGTNAPSCKPWKCPLLPSIEGAGLPQCTKGTSFRSVCSYDCTLDGFDMPQHVAKALVCSKEKRWRKNGEPACIDVEPPVFKTCPSTLVAGTERASKTSRVIWKEPSATDNSNTAVNVTLISGYASGTRVLPGKYDIVYGVFDAAGNRGRNCKFTVIVRDIKCSRIYPTPFVRVQCPNGTRTGSICEISCDPGKTLKGTSVVTCDQIAKGLYGQWNWNGDGQSTCKQTSQCLKITPPRHGALACDNWLGGSFCQAQCQNGTEIPRVNLETLYVCSDDGNWMPTLPQFTPCKAARHSHILSMPVEVQSVYYGDCTDKSTQEQIAKNFIQQMMSSLYQPEACPDNSECRPENVQIFCGGANRRKRAVRETSHQENIRSLSINFNIQLKTITSISDIQNRHRNIIKDIGKYVNEHAVKIYGNSSSPVNVTGGLFKVHCDEGTVQSTQSINCVECPEGTYYQGQIYDSEPTCLLCPKGTYQDKSGESKCISCPYTFTTHSQGSAYAADCKVGCAPGSFSTDGLEPCSLCDVGHYQTSYGQTSCHRCRGSRSTITFGASSITECQEFDLTFIGMNSTVEVNLKQNATMRSFTMSAWILPSIDWKVASVKFLNERGQEELAINGIEKVCMQTRCKTFDNNIIFDERWHQLVFEFVNCTSSIYIDGYLTAILSFNNSCTGIDIMTLVMESDSLNHSSFSQLNIWRGSKHITSGSRCFLNEHGDIFRWQDVDGALFKDAYTELPSKCDDYDNCRSSPCIHGSCTDTIGGFSCSCDSGYSGPQCKINIDDCVVNVCMNGATCVDGDNVYQCHCLPNFTGQFCEVEMTHGKWSTWGNWSECTTTCGDGIVTRKRLCNNPTPDNGGKTCVGEDIDAKDCNNTDCPVCPDFIAPVNGSAECVNSSETINCTIACNAGFDFDSEPMDMYYCGESTFSVWNFETNENPTRRLPKCKEVLIPPSISIVYSARYKELVCSSKRVETDVKQTILNKVREIVDTIPCIRNKNCTATELSISSCDGNSRKKRSIENAGFILEVARAPKDGNVEEVAVELESVFNKIRDEVYQGQFTVDVLEESYELDLNHTDVHGNAECEKGYTRVSYYCVPCGSGSYLNVDYCEPCPVGFYQDKDAQLSCKLCPSGKTTLGEGSDLVMDCSVAKEESKVNEAKVTGIAVGCSVGLFVLVAVAVAFIYRRYKASTGKHVIPSDFSAATQRPYSSTGVLKMKSCEDARVNHDMPRLERFTTLTSQDSRVMHSKPWKI